MVEDEGIFNVTDKNKININNDILFCNNTITNLNDMEIKYQLTIIIMEQINQIN